MTSFPVRAPTFNTMDYIKTFGVIRRFTYVPLIYVFSIAIHDQLSLTPPQRF